MAKSLLGSLLSRRDYVAIEQGMLIIKPISGAKVPQDWLTKNQEALIVQMLQAVGIDAFRFNRHTTGLYGKNQAGGVTLHFESLLDGRELYAIFNADLTRARNTSKGKAGSLLPEGQFRVGKRSHFYKFWKTTNLAWPPRNSLFHDYMARLRSLVFIGEYVQLNRLDAQSIKPLTITHEQLSNTLNTTKTTYKEPTNRLQSTYNSPTRTTYKDFEQDQSQQGFQEGQTTCDLNYGNKVIRKYVYKGSNIIPIETVNRPEEQTTDEWLADHNKQ